MKIIQSIDTVITRVVNASLVVLFVLMASLAIMQVFHTPIPILIF